MPITSALFLSSASLVQLDSTKDTSAYGMDALLNSQSEWNTSAYARSVVKSRGRGFQLRRKTDRETKISLLILIIAVATLISLIAYHTGGCAELIYLTKSS